LVPFIGTNHVMSVKVSQVPYRMQDGASEDGSPVCWTRQTG
jgi:hypothetical protein